MRWCAPVISVLMIMSSSLDNHAVNAKWRKLRTEDILKGNFGGNYTMYKVFVDLHPNDTEPPRGTYTRRPTTTTTSTQPTTREVEIKEKMLFDFTTMDTLNAWYELSDVVRQQGMSKAVLTLQKTKMFQRAIFFTLLNPQPNGAGFASYRVDVNLDLSNYKKIQMLCRGQGENLGYKINLRHKKQNREPFPSYEQMFQAPMGKFQIVELQLANFEPYIRGQKLNDSEPLDLAAITNFELQAYGGVYLPIKQSGTSSLEIDWIKALP